ncbi:MAG TPA: glycosyltransferase [Steroidobacteraceae bacterium]|nr:glycosyltransferase [Steroidobacteraceae bacterium]
MLHLLAALPLLIWMYLLTARGGFWRVSRQMNPWAAGTDRTGRAGPLPRVVAVIPARNEAASIGTTVSSLLRQRFAGSLRVIVVDDGSTDGTAAAARAAAQTADAADAAHAVDSAYAVDSAPRLTLIHGAPLAPGWTGKLWALQQGVEAAQALAPDYLLFTDADIEHEPDCLAGLIANAEAGRRDLVSYMVRLSVDTAAERCLIPAFVFFFLKLYPPRWTASPRSSTAGAAGGCILIRPQALHRIGGLTALRAQIIDDCALARAVKDSGGRLWLGLTRRARSLRRYGSFGQIGDMISRTAFSQLRHSYGLLAATLLGLAVTYLLPPLLLLTHDPVAVALGLAAWILMSACYLPMVLFYDVCAAWSLCLPAIAAFYAGATVHSAVRYALGRGGLWKGRAQDPGT